MKAKFLLLLLVILLQVNTSFAREMKSAHRIELSATTKVQHFYIPFIHIDIVERRMV